VAFDIFLGLLVLGLAVWIVSTRDTFAAAVEFVAFGLVVTLVWVRLAAPDVALTEAALGSGLTGGLLLGASTRLARAETVASGERHGAVLGLSAAGVCALISAAIAALVILPPEPAPTLAPDVAANIAATGLENPLPAVLMAYRAIDTLLEVVVLLLALLAMWSLAPDHLWGGLPWRPDAARAAQIGDLRDRLNGADFVIGEHHRNKRGIVAQYFVEAARIDYPIGFNGNNVNEKAVLSEG
jgi:uncharacterized MnhB-related membrane protein